MEQNDRIACVLFVIFDGKQDEMSAEVLIRDRLVWQGCRPGKAAMVFEELTNGPPPVSVRGWVIFDEFREETFSLSSHARLIQWVATTARSEKQPEKSYRTLGNRTERGIQPGDLFLPLGELVYEESPLMSIRPIG
jgi:hypothetical protein